MARNLIWVALLLALITVLALVARERNRPPAPPPLPAERVLPDDLRIRDVVIGHGAEAVPGKSISCRYTGSFVDGRVFDASSRHGSVFDFVVGTGRVIRGWDEGLVGMRVRGQAPPGYSTRAGLRRSRRGTRHSAQLNPHF